MENLLYVFIGGGIGTVLRYLLSDFLNKKYSLRHWATFWVNVSGCLLLGLASYYAIQSNQSLGVFVCVGLIGSYTTFSTFEYENINLIAHEKYSEFLKYSFNSCFFGTIALFIGYKIAKLLNKIVSF